ncbi:hypothetical protein PGTUg99_016915 [Puccinia graminis f. sp. tritici]|uniref:Uncharacterized protein n=1 Tax=Puccinia graminis f. sp. tritici TaxID=56615 RepID=A0A5B0NCF7_PUCGR|nr:hypothetical protein PGTUg99_016915 [Puccinia graminis f. sp. tritici]
MARPDLSRECGQELEKDLSNRLECTSSSSSTIITLTFFLGFLYLSQQSPQKAPSQSTRRFQFIFSVTTYLLILVEKILANHDDDDDDDGVRVLRKNAVDF